MRSVSVRCARFLKHKLLHGSHYSYRIMGQYAGEYSTSEWGKKANSTPSICQADFIEQNSYEVRHRGYYRLVHSVDRTFHIRSSISHELLFITDGIIQVFAESLDKFEPVARAYDPDLLPVKHISFGSHDNLVKVNYDCRTHT